MAEHGQKLVFGVVLGLGRLARQRLVLQQPLTLGLSRQP